MTASAKPKAQAGDYVVKDIALADLGPQGNLASPRPKCPA